MKWDTREPCGNCPYRKDAPLGLWHPENLDRLAATEQDMMGATYGCHATIKAEDPSVCAGWLLMQKKHGVPSIALRMRLRNDDALACFEAVTDGGHELYDSVQEMIEANEELGRCDCGRYLSGPGGTCPVCDDPE